MDYNVFKQEFIACMELKKYDDCKVVIKERLKNNGKLLTGISLSCKEVKCVPTIYLEQMYEYFLGGKCISEMVDEYMELFDEARRMKTPDLDFLCDFEQAKRMILCRVINTDMNSELLKGIPHISFLNLSIVFFVNVPLDGEDNSFVLIDNNIFKSWNIDVNLAYEFAHYNTINRYATSISTIEDVLFGIMGKDMSEEEQEDIRSALDGMSDKDRHFMYVLSNSSRIYGAVGILDGESLAKFASEINDDFYILPSSVHELILIPADNCCSRDELENMVCQVNETEVSAEDILSNTVYLYRRENGCVCIA